MAKNKITQCMRKIFLLATGLLLAYLIQAQVLVNIQLPATGLTIKSQLWNLSLANFKR